MKLFYKLFGYILIGIIGLLSLEGYLDYKQEIDQFDRDMADHAIQVGNMVSGMIEHAWMESGETKAIQLINDANSSDNPVRLRWVWLSATPNGSHTPIIKPEKFIQVKEGNIVSVKIAEQETDGFRYTYIPLKLKNHTLSAVEIRQSLAPLLKFNRKMLIRSSTLVFLLLLITGVILYTFINYQIRRRLVRLSDKAKRIGKGEFMPDLEIPGNDELSDLATTMNAMCHQLQSAQQQIDTVHEARIKTLEQLRHTEKLSTLGHITAGIAHEMGTPLNIVSGRAKMIEAGTLPLPDMINSAGIIRHQSDRMTQIIRQLLDFTRRSKPKYALTNILSLIKQVFEILTPMAKKQGVVLELAPNGTLPMLLNMDANQIQQVLINLIMNSIQAMPQGGRVSVELFKKETGGTNPGRSHNYLGIKFSDDGEGIDKEKIDHIFEPFYSTKKVGEGTGLGLSIVQGIVEEHNGWIEVDSENGKGTTFIIFLPMENFLPMDKT